MRALLISFTLFLLHLPVLAVNTERLEIYVSIPPQKYLVERIGGERVNVTVMIKPGYSPETYDPSPRQITALSTAHIYFQIGVPFETQWMHAISSQNPDMLVVDTCLCAGRYQQDPHIWTSPANAKRIAALIKDALIRKVPGSASFYEANYQSLIHDLDELDRDIRAGLSHVRTGYFIVSHASWGYYADDYGLTQLALESNGIQKGPRGMMELINIARREGIHTLFIQKQHPTAAAYTLANELDARAVVIDPLEENYIENLRHVSALIAEATR